MIKVKGVSVSLLSLGLLGASMFTLMGLTSALPGFVDAFQERRMIEMQHAQSVTISQDPVSQVFYQEAADKLRYQHRDFEFNATRNGLEIKAEDLSLHDRVPLVIASVKALQAGVMWSMEKGCIGGKCSPDIGFEVTARTLRVGAGDDFGGNDVDDHFYHVE